MATITEKILALRAIAEARDEETKEEPSCEELVAEICMKISNEKDVACCVCGNYSLKLLRNGIDANPWAQVECGHFENGIQCEFKQTCGHAEPDPPELTPNNTKSKNKTRKSRV